MFLEKSITKKINLLYFVDLFGPLIEVEKCLQFLSISKNTFKKYIQEINDEVSDYHISYKENKIYIRENQKKTGSIVAREILDESINLKIFYEIFRYELTLSELSEKLYLSNSTIINRVISINNYFIEKNIEIIIVNRGKYQITGKEEAIRHFMSIVFLETNNFNLIKPYQEILRESHRLIEKYFLTKQTFYKSYTVDVYLYISIVRSSQGHLIYKTLSEIPREIFGDVKLIFSYFVNKKPVINVIERIHNTTFDLLFTSNIVNIDLLESMNISKIELMINNDNYSKLEELLLQYCKLYGVSMSNTEKKELLQYLYKKIFLSKPYNQVFLNDFEIHFNYLKGISVEKLEFILKYLNENNMFLNKDISVMYEFVVFFILTDKNIRMNFFNPIITVGKKILVYSSKQVSIAEMIGYIIKDKFGDNVQLKVDYLITPYENKSIDKYDIVISDIYMSEFKDKYLYLSMIPNDKFWTEFEKRLLY